MLLYPWLRYCQGSDHEVIIEQLKYPSFSPIISNCGESLWKAVDLVDK